MNQHSEFDSWLEKIEKDLTQGTDSLNLNDLYQNLFYFIELEKSISNNKNLNKVKVLFTKNFLKFQKKYGNYLLIVNEDQVNLGKSPISINYVFEAILETESKLKKLEEYINEVIYMNPKDLINYSSNNEIIDVNDPDIPKILVNIIEVYNIFYKEIFIILKEYMEYDPSVFVLPIKKDINYNIIKNYDYIFIPYNEISVYKNPYSLDMILYSEIFDNNDLKKILNDEIANPLKKPINLIELFWLIMKNCIIKKKNPYIIYERYVMICSDKIKKEFPIEYFTDLSQVAYSKVFIKDRDAVGYVFKIL